MEAMRREREAAETRRKSKPRQRRRPSGKRRIGHLTITRISDARAIKAHGARLHGGALVIPMRNGNELHSLQFSADGEKRFLTGGRVAGCYYDRQSERRVGLCIRRGICDRGDHPSSDGLSGSRSLQRRKPGTGRAETLRSKFPDAS